MLRMMEDQHYNQLISSYPRDKPLKVRTGLVAEDILYTLKWMNHSIQSNMLNSDHIPGKANVNNEIEFYPHKHLGSKRLVNGNFMYKV